MKFILSALLLVSFGSHAKSLKVMQYNAENFFDTKYDESTHDYTYLPLNVKASIAGHTEACNEMTGFYRSQCLNLDWTDAKFTKKIVNLSKVIKSYDASGAGPDILFLEEIENINVVNKLVTKGLDKLGYISQVLIEGDDSRGIDVAIISKYPVISSKHHSIIVNGKKLDTRGILEVALNVDGKTVVVFANHWPSQANPAEERIASAELLSDLAAKADADLILAAGDFNTIATDSPYPFNYLKNFVDAEAEARNAGVSMNAGTHYFKGEWTSLDRIFIHKNSKLAPNLKSFQIMNRPFMMQVDTRTGDSIPMRSDAEKGTGFSDHLPIALEFSL
jgi:endonuclease/exonuclease/phosphatase family metal-dependent hydrolase